MDATATANLPLATMVDDLLGNSGGNTRRIPIDRLVALTAALMGPTYGVRLQLYGDLSWPAGAIGFVRADADAALNGMYKKTGNSGSGSWSRIGDLQPGMQVISPLERPLIFRPGDMPENFVMGTTVSGPSAYGTAAFATGQTRITGGLVPLERGTVLEYRASFFRTSPSPDPANDAVSMTASRRLHLAAKVSGTTGIALRRWRRQADASDFGQPTAAMTRWRVSVLPSAPLPVPGVGRPRWLIELIRARAGESFDLELEVCNGTGHLGLPADVADRSAAAAGRQHALG